MAKVTNAVEILSKIWTAWVGCTSVTDDRQTDQRQHIANVNVSLRSLKLVSLLWEITFILMRCYLMCFSLEFSMSACHYDSDFKWERWQNKQGSGRHPTFSPVRLWVYELLAHHLCLTLLWANMTSSTSRWRVAVTSEVDCGYSEDIQKITHVHVS